MADSGEAKKIAFDLVTPTELAVSEDADMVVVPGTEGDFGVLPGHTPFLTTLRAGIVDVHQAGVVDQSLFVEGGFAEATPERCTVLADQVRLLSDISADDARQRLAQAEESLGAAKGEDRAAAEIELRTAEAMMKAVEMRGTPGG
ncbi:MAG: ATP synthase F1 subunit epsilon [Rhodospirillales bacterium]|nr:ATP synthase F1 subunit epsilon [Rhodospirillales bacterium]